MRTITEEQAAEGLEKVFGIPKCPKWGSEARYNCPTCRYDCAPGAKCELTAHQSKHCDYHEEKVKP